MPKVELLHNTPLIHCATGIRMCWASEDKSDSNLACIDCDKYGKSECPNAEGISYPYEQMCDEIVVTKPMEDRKADTPKYLTGPKDKALIERIANKNMHSSVLRHLNYIFRIEASTKTLLAMTRHKAGVDFSVQSTRFTTKKRKDNLQVTMTNNPKINGKLSRIMVIVTEAINEGADNDDISMLLPQGYNYTFQVTMNAQAIQHFLKLRTVKGAHWDIRDTAHMLYDQLPEDHKYLFEDFVTPKQGE